MDIEIRTLDDVLPHISTENGFVVSRRGSHTVVDYVFANEATFANPVACECRGLKFDSEGRTIARPFHKFFNLGERQTPESIDWSRPHIVAEKLDGSMVHPCLLEGRLTFMTRMGETDQARQAFAAAGSGVRALCEAMIDQGRTPVFEFTSPDNRIIVPYEQTALTLLAVRDIVTGRYMRHDELDALARDFGVTPVPTHGSVADIRQFQAEGRARMEGEGFVVAFDTGFRVKLKSDAYVLRHRALAGLALEKHLLALVAEDALDDVLPLVADDVAGRARRYRDEVLALCLGHLKATGQFLSETAGLDQKAFAARVVSDLDPRLSKLAFRMRAGSDGFAVLKEMLRLAAHSQSRIVGLRDLFPLDWAGVDLQRLDN